MNRSQWCARLPDWMVDGGICRGFFATDDVVPPGKRVVEVPLEEGEGVFVRDLPDYIKNHGLTPASTGQALDYARANPQAQFKRMLIVAGEGGITDDPHGNKRALSFTCNVGRPAIDIRPAPERLGPQVRLLVLA